MQTEFDVQEIARRIEACLSSSGRRIAFWEDEEGKYKDLLGQISPTGIEIIDVTRRELSSKRLVLRERPHDRFVLYRSGGAPDLSDDLILDVKLLAEPFSCSMEAIWAQECGIQPTLARVVSEHQGFFGSKDRRKALAQTGLPKGTSSDLLYAMCACCLNIRETNRRDASRAMCSLVLRRWALDDDSPMRALAHSNLEEEFWSAMRSSLGYVPDGEPGIEDLALRMVEATLEGVLGDSAPPSLSADATRVLSDMARDSKTREAYDLLVERVGAIAADLVPMENRTPDMLESIDSIHQVDDWITSALAVEVAEGTANAERLSSMRSARAHSLWNRAYGMRYDLLVALHSLNKELERYEKEVPAATTLRDLWEGYVGSWFAVDYQYRLAEEAWRRCEPSSFKKSLGPAHAAASTRYDAFLEDLAARWQQRSEGFQWPPVSLGIASQANFWVRQFVEEKTPAAAPGGRIGVIVSDALRYECGTELAEVLRASRRQGLRGRTRVVVSAMASMLPSYTQLGMAALLPPGPLEIDPSSARVSKGGLPTHGLDNRNALLNDAAAGSIALRADDVLEKGLPSLDGAPIVFIFHNRIDDHRDSVDNFDEVRKAFADIEELCRMLVRAGCCRVVVTSDHGFIFQAHDIEDRLFAEPAQLSGLKKYGKSSSYFDRRYVLSEHELTSGWLISYDASEVSLTGDFHIALPRGIQRLRLQGSGTRYVHGGLTAQEAVVPVVTVDVVSSSSSSHQTAVEAYPVGRATITGPSISVDVYQVEPIGSGVTPASVRIGVYSHAGKLLSTSERLLELASDDSSSEARRTRVSLSLTDDVDDYQSCCVRVGLRMGGTNQFKTVWEREYQIMRAFGMDF